MEIAGHTEIIANIEQSVSCKESVHLPENETQFHVYGLSDPRTEALQNPNETRLETAKPARRFYISPENARKMQQMAIVARAKKKAETLAAIAKAQSDMEIVKPLLPKAIEIATELAKIEPSEAYRRQRLALVRSQLAKADSELTELLDDPKADQSRLKAILDAVKVLSEQERKLDNRADPGSYRPRTPSTKQPSTGFAPIEE